MLPPARFNPSQVGVFEELFQNQSGCDSLLITTIILLEEPVTIIREFTCDPEEVGLEEQVFFAQNGCDSIVTTIASLLPASECEEEGSSIFIPNIFSPNGDGINDVFLLFSNEVGVRITSFRIYSRWGERVYASTNILPNNLSVGWDGTFAGKPMDAGVYVYWAEEEMPDGGRKVFKGDVTLVR